MGRAAVVCLALWLAAAASSRFLGGAAVVAPLWHVAGEGRGMPAASGSTVYFLTKRHEVVAVDASTGKARWRRTTGEPGHETLGSSILVSGSVVMVGDYAVIGFDRHRGIRNGGSIRRMDTAPGCTSVMSATVSRSLVHPPVVCTPWTFRLAARSGRRRPWSMRVLLQRVSRCFSRSLRATPSSRGTRPLASRLRAVSWWSIAVRVESSGVGSFCVTRLMRPRGSAAVQSLVPI
jgi:hypothetical protein